MRSVKEWIGKDDDSVPPPRVRLRVFDAQGGRCYLCTRKIQASEYWEADHVRALINGGENREKNLKPACNNCCRSKTALDLVEKSKIATIRKKHLGVSKTKKPWSKFRKKMNGEVVLRGK